MLTLLKRRLYSHYVVPFTRAMQLNKCQSQDVRRAQFCFTAGARLSIHLTALIKYLFSLTPSSGRQTGWQMPLNVGVSSAIAGGIRCGDSAHKLS